ncbi:Ty3b-g, partial [Ophiophagus hannah]
MSENMDREDVAVNSNQDDIASDEPTQAPLLKESAPEDQATGKVDPITAILQALMYQKQALDDAEQYWQEQACQDQLERERCAQDEGDHHEQRHQKEMSVSSEICRGDASSLTLPTVPLPKLVKMGENEDVNFHLTKFEATACPWPKEEWVSQLVPCLTGKALKAFKSPSPQESADYKHVQPKIQQQVELHSVVNWQQFRTYQFKEEEGPRKALNQLREFARRWLSLEMRTSQEVFECVVLEQFVNILPEAVQHWVLEHQPNNCNQALELAENYFLAHQTSVSRYPETRKRDNGFPLEKIAGYWLKSSQKVQPTRMTKYHPGGKEGPWATNCMTWSTKGLPKSSTKNDISGQTFMITEDNTKSRRPRVGKPQECFHCHTGGHQTEQCPLATYEVVEEMPGDTVTKLQLTTAVVNGKPLKALLDTGCSQSLIKSVHVSPQMYIPSQQLLILGADGESRPHAVAKVPVEVGGRAFSLHMGVNPTLPYDVILGQDLPNLKELLEANPALITQAQSQMQWLWERLPDPQGTLSETPGKTKKPKAQKKRKKKKKKKEESPCMETQVNNPKERTESKWELPENIGQLQASDPSLRKVLSQIGSLLPGGKKVTQRNDILYVTDKCGSRLVVPMACRSLIMRISHTIPWTGHQEHQHTYARIARVFWWPGMYADTRQFCACCKECQKSEHLKDPKKSPLLPLPMVDIPFRTIAMDIIGPLAKSQRGYRFILVVCDYATSYPEAFALRTDTSQEVASTLIKLFSRIGIPGEIVIDREKNITSQTMNLLYKKLGIKRIKISPYHPQSDGLVERFNQTLKQVLRKFISETGSDWDRWLLVLLFAYWELSQASMEFSPYELLCGPKVRRPLQMVREIWEGKAKSLSRNVSYILQMGDKLDQIRELASDNIRHSQVHKKVYYDQRTNLRVFNPGQRVLLFLPSTASKLLAQWQGPFSVLRRIGPVSYEILMPGHCPSKQTWHINLLKKWVEPASQPGSSLMTCEIPEQVEEDNGVFSTPSEAADQFPSLKKIYSSPRQAKSKPDAGQETSPRSCGLLQAGDEVIQATKKQIWLVPADPMEKPWKPQKAHPKRLPEAQIG